MATWRKRGWARNMLPSRAMTMPESRRRSISLCVPVLVLGAVWLGCGSESGMETKASDFVKCSRDEQCPSGQGCNVEGNANDGYCSQLCTESASCPARFECPSFLRTNTRSDCDELGKHSGKASAISSLARAGRPRVQRQTSDCTLM
jgi:hypothetical protein